LSGGFALLNRKESRHLADQCYDWRFQRLRLKDLRENKRAEVIVYFFYSIGIYR
jgi:hypothetical protein